MLHELAEDNKEQPKTDCNKEAHVEEGSSEARLLPSPPSKPWYLTGGRGSTVGGNIAPINWERGPFDIHVRHMSNIVVDITGENIHTPRVSWTISPLGPGQIAPLQQACVGAKATVLGEEV